MGWCRKSEGCKSLHLEKEQWLKICGLLYIQGEKKIVCWDTLTSSEVSNCDGVLLEIYLDHKFHWPWEGLKCESLACEVFT